MNNHFGKKLREIREEKNMLLRELAAYLEVDAALISKVERGDRNINKNQIEKISNLFKVEKEELTILWIADKIERVVDSELDLGLKAFEYIKNSIK